MQNKGLRPRVPKGFSFIVTAFDIKIVDELEGFLNAEKGRKTLIIHRSQGLLDTPKICFDTFGQ